MDASPQPTASKTTLLDLNDDCLKEVFAHMDRNGLAAVADVCVRFRQNSMYSARSKSKYLGLCVDSSVHDYSRMRNFGAFIERITVDMSGLYRKSRAEEYQKRLIELLSRYCVGASIELRLYEIYISDETAILMVPLLARVQKLDYDNLQFNEKLVKNLPFWAPELRELKFNGGRYIDRYSKSLHQKFPKLVSISFECHDYGDDGRGDHGDMAEFFKKNPQLKQAEFGVVSNCIIRSIAKYVPKIEKIRFRFKYPYNSNIAEYFGQLRALKSLELVAHDDHSFVQNLIHKIAAANIALEFLKLSGSDVCTAQLIEGVSKLQHLKTLHLRYVWNLTATFLIAMVKPLNGLLEIVLESLGMSMNSDELLTLARNAKKLQKLDWTAPIGKRPSSIIDAATFMKLKAITEQRGEKLTLRLPAVVFTADIPEEMISAAQGLLSLEIS